MTSKLRDEHSHRLSRNSLFGGLAPSKSTRRIWDFCRPSVRRHRRHLFGGMLGSLALVLTRIALPWPLAHMVKPWLKHPDKYANSVSMGAGAFLLLFAVLGLADFLSRYEFARFSIEALRDIRADALRTIEQDPARTKEKSFGDVISRLTGDIARVREGLKGFFIHVVTSAMLFVGIVTAMLWLDPRLALVMAVTLASVIALTVVVGRRIQRKAFENREREGRLASSIHRSTRGHGLASTYVVKPSKGFHNASLTRMRERGAWAVHVIMGVAFLVSFYLATHGASRLSNKHLFVFLAYILTLHRPIVRLSRQGTRIGKLLACMARIERIAQPDLASGKKDVVGPLRTGITLSGVEVRDPKTERLRLGPLDLTVGRGEKVAVCGGMGAGKSSLLEAVARVEPVAVGAVLWDDTRIDVLHGRQRRARMEWFAQDATPGEGFELSPSFRRSDLVLLDDPARGLATKEAAQQLGEILRASGRRTLLVALSRLSDAAQFERLLVLRKGQLVFDGPPVAYTGF